MKRELGILKRALSKDWLNSLYVGVVNIGSYLAVLVALIFIEVSVAEPLALFAPLLTVVLSKYVFHERIKTRMVGTFIMIAGLVMLFF